MRLFSHLLFYGTALGLCLFSSCKKEAADWSYSTDNTLAQAAFQDVYAQISETSESDGNIKSGCASVTFSAPLGEFPNTITIDFGSTGCTSASDNRIRKGKIIATYSGRWRDAGTTINIDLEDYSVDGYAVEGSKVITNNGTNGNGNINYSDEITGGQVTDPADGSTFSWQGTVNYEWVEGSDTDFITGGMAGLTDDVYHITGSGDGVSRGGTAYTSVINEALVRDFSCKWVTDGSYTVTPSGGFGYTADFGDGACDGDVTITYLGFSSTITLP